MALAWGRPESLAHEMRLVDRYLKLRRRGSAPPLWADFSTHTGRTIYRIGAYDAPGMYVDAFEREVERLEQSACAGAL